MAKRIKFNGKFYTLIKTENVKNKSTQGLNEYQYKVKENIKKAKTNAKKRGYKLLRVEKTRMFGIRNAKINGFRLYGRKTK